MAGIAICSRFAYRRNADETVDAICLKCFLTVATAMSEAELHLHEQAHRCVGLTLPKSA
jgi:hypothetical protein